MPLSDREQRMLEQIENALDAEDPKFASRVRGGSWWAPTTRRQIQGGVALFVIGLAMLISGVAVTASMIGSFPILSVFGFLVMFGGAVVALTGPRIGGVVDRCGSAGAPKRRHGKGAGGSFTSRIEDRFRHRFDD